MRLSLIIPAHNEEAYLPETLRCVSAARKNIPDLELIVVDNESTDATRAIAEKAGATVLTETIRNIAQVRNTGAAASSGEVLIFLDADTHVRPTTLEQIAAAMEDPRCLGGSVRVEYTPSTRWWVRPYLMGWEFWGHVMRMHQGAAQFVRREAFQQLGGYDTSIYVGEDIQFVQRLKKLARTRRGYTTFIDRPRVLSSSRRFTKMSIPRILFLTNPIAILLFWRARSLWTDWYAHPPR